MDFRSIFGSCLGIGGQAEQPQASEKSPAKHEEPYQPSTSGKRPKESDEDQRIVHQKMKLDSKILKDILDEPHEQAEQLVTYECNTVGKLQNFSVTTLSQNFEITTHVTYKI